MATIDGIPDPERAPARAASDLSVAYVQHYASLVRLASLLLDDVGTCEEVVQDAFVNVWRRPPALVDPDRLPAYLPSTTTSAP